MPELSARMIPKNCIIRIIHPQNISVNCQDISRNIFNTNAKLRHCLRSEIVQNKADQPFSRSAVKLFFLNAFYTVSFFAALYNFKLFVVGHDIGKSRKEQNS